MLQLFLDLIVVSCTRLYPKHTSSAFITDTGQQKVSSRTQYVLYVQLTLHSAGKYWQVALNYGTPGFSKCITKHKGTKLLFTVVTFRNYFSEAQALHLRIQFQDVLILLIQLFFLI